MKDIEERVIRNEESINSAHKRLDEQGRKIIIVEDSWHKHSGRIHTVEGILTGMETMIKEFVVTSKAQAVKTGENTSELRDLKARAETFLTMMRWFFVFCGTVASALVFVGGSLMGLW